MRIGKHVFVGNSGMAAPGKVPRAAWWLCSPQPRAGSWPSGARHGSARRRPDCVRSAGSANKSRTYAPTLGLKVSRGLVELCRLAAPIAQVLLTLACLSALIWLAGRGWWARRGALRRDLGIGGLLTATSAVLAKWILVGRLRPSDHPLWRP